MQKHLTRLDLFLSRKKRCRSLARKAKNLANRYRSGLTKYTVAAILMAIPLYPKFPFIRVPGTYVSVRLEDFILVFASLVLLLNLLPDIKGFLKNKINQAIFLYLMIALVSVASAIFVTKTVQPHLAVLHWFRRVEYFIPFFLGLFALKGKKGNLEFYLKVLMITILLAFVYGLGQKYLNWPVIITQNLEYAKGVALRYIPGSHINSTFAGHYDLGTFLILLLPIYISLLFLLKGTRTKLLTAMIILSGLWLLAYSGSRISTASYLVAAVSALLLIRKYKAIPLVIIISVLFFAMSSNLVARYGRIIEVGRKTLQEKIRLNYLLPPGTAYALEEKGGLPRREKVSTPTPEPASVFEDRSTSIRLAVEWPRAIRAFSKNPLLGTGFSSITLATDNEYLRLFGEVGILGFLAFFLIFARIGKMILFSFPLMKSYQGLELGYFAGVAGALPGIFLNAVFIDVFEASKFAIVFWLLMGMLISMGRNGKNVEKD